MPEIIQVSAADVLRALPEYVRLEEGLEGESTVDLLIACAGFEERATAIINDLRGIAIQDALIVEYPTNLQDNAGSTAKFRQLPVSGTRSEIVYSRFAFLRRLHESLQPYKDQAGLRVVIDISGMSSYVIYRVLSAIWERLPGVRLAVYYVEAAEYSPTESEWSAFFGGVIEPTDNLVIAERYEATHFQSRGIEITYESDVFPGQNVGPLATEVVAIPSFSLLRMKALLAYAESNYSVPKGNVRWFLGHPPDRVKNGWRFDALAALYNVRTGGEAISTRDYREVFQKLDTLWEEVSTERHIVIASQGSKMQHLGIFLFLVMHPECGQILCEPQEFIANRYSTGIGPKWWVDFGTVESVHRALTSRGDLQFRW